MGSCSCSWSASCSRLSLLWRLCWFHLRPSSSRGRAKRTTLHRLLKPRCPDDGPACRLASPASSGAGPAPVRPWREVKSRRGAPKRVNTEGFACPNPKCPSFGISDDQIHAAFWGWQAWPGRAHPDLSRSCLPHHLHGPAPYPSLPFENPLPCRVAVVLTALARGLDPSEAPRVAGPPTSDHHEPFSRARARTLRPCTSTRISHLQLPHVQLDELRTRLRCAIQVLWLWLAIDPLTRDAACA
jgi:hypothetical protein